MNDISSTEVRNMIRDKKDISEYVDEDVIEYINKNNLYRDDGNENI
jgi:nicotinic acid mononucleotide adenylyltransferase